MKLHNQNSYNVLRLILSIKRKTIYEWLWKVNSYMGAFDTNLTDKEEIHVFEQKQRWLLLYNDCLIKRYFSHRTVLFFFLYCHVIITKFREIPSSNISISNKEGIRSFLKQNKKQKRKRIKKKKEVKNLYTWILHRFLYQI